MAPLDRDRWRVLQPLLDRALDLSAEERDSWLDSLRAESPTLADEVTTLLAGESAADRRGLLLEPPSAPFAAPPPFDRPFVASLEGMEVGAYTLERPIGRGGMGSVWLARRTDGRFEGVAAVKLLNLSLLGPVGQERFRREGSALARLTHPGIARLLDAGVSAAGQPYLVLEHVDGERIDAYAAARALAPAERIGLVLQVLDAVGHAHANLVVHRDLKPSNILVTRDGTVKLLDFGIAKLLDAEGEGSANGHGAPVALTVDGASALTPEFAAPEQVQGDAVTTATDAYACGVLLYLLLSGRHPTGEGCRTPEAAIRAVVEVEPTRLGLGDLDAVLAKALRKAPRERYQTVAALADDLSRVLRHEPVSARADTLAYRMGRFVRRHRVAVAAAVGGVALLAGAGLRERALRAQAQAETRKAAAVEQYLEGVFGVADPYAPPNAKPPGEVTARALLDRGAARVDSTLAGQPAVQAQLRVAFGRVYTNLGLFDRAAPVLRRALAQRRALYGARHPAVAEAMYELGQVLTNLDSIDAAEALLREAVAQRRALVGSGDTATASALERLAAVLEERDDYTAAEPMLHEALAIRRAVNGPDHEEVAATLNDLAVLYFQQGRYDEAEPVYRQALAIQTRRLGPEHIMTAETLMNLAQVQQFRGHLAEAETLYRRSLAVKRKVLGDLHPSVTMSLDNLGDMLARLDGRPDDAEPLIREALALNRRMFGERHRDVAASLNILCTVLRGKGDFAGAEAAIREALAINRALYGPEHSTVALAENSLAATLHQSGRPEEAVPIFRQSLARFTRTQGSNHRNALVVTGNLARALRDAGSTFEAESLLRALSTRVDSAKAGERYIYIAAQLGLGRTLVEGRPARAAEALPVLERALAMATKDFRGDDVRLMEARIALAEGLAATGESARADSLLRAAAAVLQKQRRAQPRLAARADAVRAAVTLALGRPRR